MAFLRPILRFGWTGLVAVSLSGCSACADTDTSLLEPLDAGGTDGAAAGTDGSTVLPDGASCPIGFILCASGCVDPSADPRNCGGCGRACADGEACVSGACTCPAGTTCGGGGLGNPDNCGGTSCDALEVCIDSVCRCRAGRTRVGGECIDLSSDPNNCGAPGNRCPDGTVCYAGGCHGGCPDGTRNCDGACVRLYLDPANCGECGRSCNRDEFCTRGECQQYRGGVGCSSCPCDSCTGDFSTCCPVAGPTGLVACIDAERCP